MDLSLDVEDYKLNVRSAGIVVHNGKLLVHKNVNDDFYALMGGRVAIGEDSVRTIKREFVEEVGKAVDVIGYVATIENFFEMNGKRYHEILFVHELEFADEQDKLIDYSLKNIEGKDYLHYEWIDLNEIDDCPLYPKVIKDVLKEKVFPVHKVNYGS